ncbi:ATP-dependent RNA helicase dbp4 [Coemansia sp. RSA 1722]|nr:ATP-dependent RNA helicase dbp4 [Coemansia sp. RSA 485]KAJ2600175.1 ATP-dependent RNA helicase dbp4 [Coemansia sp. RSA 1722]KAJ2640109.1 ATP-dependent RNA helicase dbp4 [Coemansia sp. RSA 1286]
MGNNGKGAQKPKPKQKPMVNKTTQQRQKKRQEQVSAIEELGQRALELSKAGPNSEHKLFSDLPISRPTLQGLERANYLEMTEIQHKTLPYALAKRDVLGAAKTGSGKTLAFLIPVLENLYRSRWTHMDGLGALVISPTRELAMQIFEVLCKIGRFHKFSAGLIIGGKRVEEEKEILDKMNILVCTPGRLLQHMDETAGFDCNNLQALVLDEADRILDMGFKKTMNAIIANLPKQRQTLLFSATQTKSVKDLARLSLERPEYVGVHEKEKTSTPERLAQYYMVVDLPKKLDMLFSFIKTHLQTKTIVFMSSGKQVRFVYETFCKMQPGTPLLHMHGKQKQMMRVEIFERFMRMNKAVLFCTDIAARGLDFPAVDWVVQMDCPEDCDTYLHRVGRTARYDASGKSLMFLLPSEEPEMAQLMKNKKIPIKEISPKSGKIMTVSQQMQHLCFQDPEIKYLGQRAFVTYVRSVFLQKNKKVFSVDALPLEAYAESLGLPGAPNIRFVKKTAKNESYDLNNMLTAEEREQIRKLNAAEIELENAAAVQGVKAKTKVEKMFARKNAGVLTDHYQKLIEHEGDNDDGNGNGNGQADSDDDNDFITLKRADHALTDDSDDDADVDADAHGDDEDDVPVVKTVAINPSTGLPVTIPNIPADQMSKRQLRKVKEKIIKNTRNTKIVFDDDGNARPVYDMQNEDSFRKEGDVGKLVSDFQERNRILMEEADVDDVEVARQKRKEKLLARKIREREKELGGQDDQEERVAVLKTASDDESMYSAESSSSSSSDEGAVQGRGRSTARVAKRGYDSDSGSESQSEAEPVRKDYRRGPQKKHNRGGVLEVDDTAMSLEDQERLALQLLGGN